MASYSEHISQAKHNLSFLEKINDTSNNVFWDWHVTVCYYVSVHLVNAHLAKTNMHYRKHEDVATALNPFIDLSLTKVSEEVYLAYAKLQNLSRRSRYLISENMNNRGESMHFTYDKHFKRSLGHLDKIMNFINDKYDESFTKTDIKCKEGVGIVFNFFNIIND